MVKNVWWLRIMGIGASTNVKEIRIDQKDAKWESYPSSATSRRSSRGRSLTNLGRKFISSAENAANGRRLQQLNTALEASEKRAQDAEQRIRQLERELATLELRNMELADEATWLRKQLSDRPEVPLSQRPPTGSKGIVSGACASTAGDNSDAYRTKQTQYVSKLESQIKLYEEDILKLKTKMNKETQRLQAELEDQKHRNEKEVRSLDNRLIEASKLNQKYEEVISSKISTDTVAQLRNEVMAGYGKDNSASTVHAAATASASGGVGINLGSDSLSQSKSRAQLILELTEQITVQQDKIRYLEEEIVQRDIELVHLKSLAQKSEDIAVLSASMRKSSRSSADRSANAQRTTMSTSSSRRTVQSEPPASTATPVVANEDEIEALLNNPAIMCGQDESDEEMEKNQKKEAKEPTALGPMNLSVSQDLQHQQINMSASLRSVPTSWRKDPLSGSCTGAGLPPSGANPKRIISISNTVDGNNLGGKIGPSYAESARPKTMAGGRQKPTPSPRRQHTVDEGGVNIDRNEPPPHPTKPARQVSADNATNQSGLGTRTHSAPMFAFKPRPSSKQSKRSALSTAASIVGSELPPPIDLEETADAEEQGHKKQVASIASEPRPPNSSSSASKRKNSDAIEVLSLHDQDTNYGGNLATGGYDSSTAAYDDEGDIEDGCDDDEQNADDYNSDQEIRRRFEERWRKSTTGPPDSVEEVEVHRPKIPRPPAGGGVGQAAASGSSSSGSAVPSADPKQRERDRDRERERVSTSAKSQDSGFLGDSCASTNSLSLWKGRNKRHMSLQQPAYDPLDVDKLLEM